MARLCAIARFIAQSDRIFLRSRYAGWLGECVFTYRQKVWLILTAKAYVNRILTDSCLQ